MKDLGTANLSDPPLATEEIRAVNATIKAEQMKHPWRGKLRAAGGSIGLLLALLIVWDRVVAVGLVSEIIVPAPKDVALAIGESLRTPFFYENLWVTLYEVLFGFAIAAVLGFALGSFLGMSRLAREIAYPYVIAFQGLPKVVLAPLFITLFGFGVASKVFMVIVIAFFPIFINTMAGLLSVDSEASQLMRSFGASRWQWFVHLALPHSLPSIFVGIQTSMTLALVGALVGEFVGAERGIGYLLQLYAYQLRVDLVWALIVILSAIGVGLFLLVQRIHRSLIFWESNGYTKDGGAA